ncbi:MAG: discoidin domain-containing protein, partial [Candidatus Competibacter sp.]
MPAAQALISCHASAARVLIVLFVAFLWGIPHPAPAATVTVDVDLASGPVNTIIPAQALGATVDGHSRGDSATIFRPATLAAMHSVGLRSLSYRLRTELGIAVWHWNPRGRWSDPTRTQGYWASDGRVRDPITVSYGYRLPRRGNTIDQAENDGYSRLVDGDLTSFWKSNPYLDHRYTGEDDARHPQWVIADLGRRQPVNAIRIVWGVPYATRYRVQYWDGEDPRDPDEYPPGGWRDFTDTTGLEGQGGEVTLRLAPMPISVRFVRVLMSAASGTAPAGSSDLRDGLGYAIHELYLGHLEQGVLRDAVRHGAGRDRQTRFFVSSTDPWHRASDFDPAIEQPGIDRVFTSGLTSGLPMLLPVGVLYDTPANGASLLRYLRQRGYPVQRVEMGEEPDGQYVAPEDYGALYLQVADALHAVDPGLELGGPAFQSLDSDPMMAWAGYSGVEDQSWLTRLLAYLNGRGRERDLAFVSFEWYPFDDICAPPGPHLLQGPQLLAEALDDLHEQGLPASVPLLMTEYGYSAFATQAEVDLPGALFNADTVGQFLTLGGAATYLYGYEPSPLEREPNCASWGNNTLFLSDNRRRIRARTATYYGARLLTRQWIGAADQPHDVYSGHLDLAGKDAALVSAYPILRPNGLWSV